MPRNSRHIGLGADPLEETTPLGEAARSQLIPTSPSERANGAGPRSWEAQTARARGQLQEPQVSLIRRSDVRRIAWASVALVLFGLAVLSIRERAKR